MAKRHKHSRRHGATPATRHAKSGKGWSGTEIGESRRLERREWKGYLRREPAPAGEATMAEE